MRKGLPGRSPSLAPVLPGRAGRGRAGRSGSGSAGPEDGSPATDRQGGQDEKRAQPPDHVLRGHRTEVATIKGAVVRGEEPELLSSDPVDAGGISGQAPTAAIGWQGRGRPQGAAVEDDSGRR